MEVKLVFFLRSIRILCVKLGVLGVSSRFVRIRSGGVKRPGRMNSWHQKQAFFSPSSLSVFFFSLLPLPSSPAVFGSLG